MNYKTRQPFPDAAYVEGQRNFTAFDRSLTSGLTDSMINSPGDFLYIDQASTGIVSVELNMRQGGTLAPILLAAGGSIECDFASVKLTAAAQLGKTVRVIIGNGAKVKSGAPPVENSSGINVIDGGKVRSTAGFAFMGYASVAAGGGVGSYIQLFNPAASGKTVFVQSVRCLAGGAQEVGVGVYNTQLGTLFGAAASKKIGAANSSARFYTDNTTGGSLYSSYYTVLTVTATASDEFVPREPIVVEPGKGLILRGHSSATIIKTSMEWFEE